MKRPLPAVAIAAAALVAFAPPAVVRAASDYETSRSFSQDANTMLREVSAARSAIRTGKRAEAMTDLKQAMQAMQAHDRAATRARANHTAMLIPVYGELVQGSVLAANVAATPVPSLSPTPGASAAPIASASPTAMSTTKPAKFTVRRTSAQFTSLAVDLQKSGARIAAAQRALAGGNMQAASDTLASIGSDLVVNSTSADLPLLTARENLAVAHEALAKHDDAHAKAAIAAASAALKRYATSPGAHAADARALSKQLSSFETTAAKHRSGSENATASWWTRVKNWFAGHA